MTRWLAVNSENMDSDLPLPKSVGPNTIARLEAPILFSRLRRNGKLSFMTINLLYCDAGEKVAYHPRVLSRVAGMT